MISVEKVSKSGISGWSVSKDGAHPATVKLAIDGHVVREVVADICREDLGKIARGGKLGFHIPLSNDFLREVPETAICSLFTEEFSSPTVIKLPGTGKEKFDPFNKLGECRTLNKDGYFTIQFKHMAQDHLERQLAFSKSLMVELEEMSLPCFLTYGTLLGCIRSQDFIAHDDDFDVGLYIGENLSNDEIDVRSVQICRELESRGYYAHRFSSGQIQISLHDVHVDLFLSWSMGTKLFLNFAINGELSTSEVFPLARGALRGTDFTIPRRSEVVCNLLYGETWRTPDLNFRWQRSAFNAAADKDMNENLYYWENYYHASASSRTHVPSQFAAFALGEIVTTERSVDLLVDVGCGDGRDTRLLAQAAKLVVGLDGSENIIRHNSALGWSGIQFIKCNFCDRKEVEDISLRIASEHISQGTARDIIVYTRFFLHAIDDAAEAHFLEFCIRLSEHARSFTIMVEYRTTQDKRGTRETAEHYRRYIDHQHFINTLVSNGFSLTYCAEGRGMAKYRRDDAFVGRVVVSAHGKA